MDTRLAYAALVGLVALARLAELAVSRRHAAALLRRGGIEVGARHYPSMVAVHAAFLLSCPLEVWRFDRPWRPVLAATMGALLACAAALRYWAIATLGERWSTRVIFLPGEPLVEAGPYRLLRHPNYLAVAIEFLALPLLHSAWATAAVFGVANGLLLRTRIRLEDSALRPAARTAGEERA